MKKHVLFTALIISLSFLSAQNSQVQVVVPKQIFAGDTGELQISFSSKKDFSSTELSAQYFEYPLNVTDLSVKKIRLSKIGKDIQNSGQFNYVFSIIFTPWKTGSIKIPPYTLGKALSDSPDSNSSESSFLIIPSEI